MSEQSIDGACLCGTVHYRITGEIKGFQYCHCSRCRRFTGSAHAANLFTLPEDFMWSAGEDFVSTFMLEGTPKFPTAFCKNCGSSLPSMSSSGKYGVIPAGTLDADPGIAPSQSIFWESRADWYREVSELPKHAEMPG